MSENFFSKNLYAYKCAYRLENADLAERLYSTPQSVGRWLNEGRTPSQSNVRRIADHMGVSAEDLMEKDLALYFMTRSGMVKPDAVNLAAEGEVGYGESVPKPRVIKHLESIREGLQSMLDDNNRALLELK